MNYDRGTDSGPHIHRNGDDRTHDVAESLAERADRYRNDLAHALAVAYADDRAAVLRRVRRISLLRDLGRLHGPARTASRSAVHRFGAADAAAVRSARRPTASASVML